VAAAGERRDDLGDGRRDSRAREAVRVDLLGSLGVRPAIAAWSARDASMARPFCSCQNTSGGRYDGTCGNR
jgi:hypothetical protein